MHMRPQVPQWVRSVWVLTHTSLQRVGVGSVQTHTPGRHIPLQHDWVSPQVVPQAPQCWTSFCVSTQRPSQRCSLPMQGGGVHTPATQRLPAMQAFPQAPQWATLD